MTTDFPRRRRKPTLSLPDVATPAEIVGNKHDENQNPEVGVTENNAVNAIMIGRHLRIACISVLHLPNTCKEEREDLLIIIQALEGMLKKINNDQAEEVAYRIKQLVETARDKHTTEDEIEYQANLLHNAVANMEEVQAIVVKIATMVVGNFIGVTNV